IRLDRGPERHDLIGIDVAERLSAEQLGDVAPDRGHAGRTADEDDTVEIGGPELGVLERTPAGDARAGEERLNELLEAHAGHGEGFATAERILDVDRVLPGERVLHPARQVENDPDLGRSRRSGIAHVFSGEAEDLLRESAVHVVAAERAVTT